MFYEEFWFGKLHSLDLNELDYMKMKLKIEDKNLNILEPCYFYLRLNRENLEGEMHTQEIIGCSQDILGLAKINGFHQRVSPHLEAMLFTQEYDEEARANGASKNILVYKAVIVPARLKEFQGPQTLAVGTQQGREDFEGNPIVETFVMRKVY